MTTIYSARWVLPVSSVPIEHGAVAVDGPLIVGVGSGAEIASRFPAARIESFGESAILPGLINTHTHLELTALRGYLENEESDFFAWLRKLTLARLERMTPDDIRVSAAWGACEAVRAGITCVGDARDAGPMSMLALQDVGITGCWLARHCVSGVVWTRFAFGCRELWQVTGEGCGVARDRE